MRRIYRVEVLQRRSSNEGFVYQIEMRAVGELLHFEVRTENEVPGAILQNLANQGLKFVGTIPSPTGKTYFLIVDPVRY